MNSKSPVSTFLEENFLHFNAGESLRAAQGYKEVIQSDGKIILTLSGAMSSARLGISLAKMIRSQKIHAISTTGANLEEDIFRLIAHSEFEHIPQYRMSPDDELKLLKKGMNRVTDLAIPEETAMRKLESFLFKLWKEADLEREQSLQKNHHSQDGRYTPQEIINKLLDLKEFQNEFDGKTEESWVLAAKEMRIPIFVAGWEDSTTGNFFSSYLRDKSIAHSDIVISGPDVFIQWGDWYLKESGHSEGHPRKMGFFQIGGGIAGDFPICVIPSLHQDSGIEVPVLSYFCQIGDSQEKYGGYSGASPSEKITWGKLSADAKMYDIKSDATIVAPLIFAYVLGL